MNHERKRRKVDRSLLESVRKLPCLGCITAENLDTVRAAISDNDGRTLSHPHHLKTVGSGGDDVAENVVPLCQKHHIEIHASGISAMARKYPLFASWLDGAGWSEDELNGWSRHE